jgi:4-diphosphocytidyl-2-C-methyl-D-erythritol kinase
LLAIANGLALNNPHIVDAAAAAGADVPVCLMASARLMHGRGEIVSAPLELPTLPVVLVFPGIPLATAPVFAAFDPAAITRHTPYQEREIPRTLDAVLEFLRNEPNDLEPAAKKLVPSIGIAMGKLRQTDAVLVRMSGSGSAVFGIYRTKEAAQAAAQTIKTQQPDWWVEDAKLK